MWNRPLALESGGKTYRLRFAKASKDGHYDPAWFTSFTPADEVDMDSVKNRHRRDGIGGFGAASDLTWNLQGSVGYKFNKCISLEVEYRYFDTDYSDSGFTYDIAQSGALIGLNLRF